MRALLCSAPLFWMLAACSPGQSSNTTSESDRAFSIETEATTECVGAFERAFAEQGEKRLLLLPRIGPQKWGASEPEVVQSAQPITEKRQRDAHGLEVQVDGYTHWLRFEFSGGRLSRVYERHNDAGRATEYIAALKAAFGSDAALAKEGRECSATWITPTGFVIGQWQPSDQYFEVDYSPAQEVGPNIPVDRQQEIFRYFVGAEDRMGREGALREAAAKYHLTEDDIFRIAVAGVDSRWEIPPPASAPDPTDVTSRPEAPAPERVREIARASLPKEDRKGYDELRARGFTEDQARGAAAPVRRLCEAAGGRDCS